jgi:hypothetical protein
VASAVKKSRYSGCPLLCFFIFRLRLLREGTSEISNSRTLLIEPPSGTRCGNIDFDYFLRNQPRGITVPVERGWGWHRSPLSHCYVLTSRAVTRQTPSASKTSQPRFFCESRDGPHLNDSRTHPKSEPVLLEERFLPACLGSTTRSLQRYTLVRPPSGGERVRLPWLHRK